MPITVRARTLQAWVAYNFDPTEIAELATRKTQQGYRGLTKASDISKLYSKFRGEIWDKLARLDYDCSAMTNLLNSHYGPLIHDGDSLEMAATWIAVEETCKMIVRSDNPQRNSYPNPYPDTPHTFSIPEEPPYDGV